MAEGCLTHSKMCRNTILGFVRQQTYQLTIGGTTNVLTLTWRGMVHFFYSKVAWMRYESIPSKIKMLSNNKEYNNNNNNKMDGLHANHLAVFSPRLRRHVEVSH